MALQINTNRTGSYVLLFLRPSHGVYKQPQTIRLDGKSTTVELDVTKADMPNFFVEAMTVADGKLHSVAREIFLPPEKRVLDVDVEPSSEEYRPGETANVRLRLTDHFGQPYVGSTIVAVYDKSVEYISGGSNVPEIRAFFWKWRRQHQPQYQTNLGRMFGNLVVGKPMHDLGIFGASVADTERGFATVGSAVARCGAWTAGAAGGSRFAISRRRSRVRASRWRLRWIRSKTRDAVAENDS